MDETISLEKKMSIEARKQRIPAGGLFELTPLCTLDCKMCYVHLTKQQMNGRKELSTEQWIKLMDEAYERGMLYILLTGGECLLHSGFKEIYLHAKKLGLLTTVNTNATSITDEHIELFRKSPPRGIHITLYGSNEETYEKVCGQRAYQRVTQNILKLKAAGIPLKINITPSKYLLDDVPEIIAFARREQLAYNINPALMKANDETGRSMDDYGISAEEAIRLAEAIRVAEQRPLYQNEYIAELPKLEENSILRKGVICSAGQSTFALTWEGKMRPCVSLWENPIDVLEVGFDKAWEAVGKRAAAQTRPLECSTCRYGSVCKACVVARSDEKNPGHCNPEICKETLGLINAGIVKAPALTK